MTEAIAIERLGGFRPYGKGGQKRWFGGVKATVAGKQYGIAALAPNAPREWQWGLLESDLREHIANKQNGAK